jgi:replicative DNA helicase
MTSTRIPPQAMEAEKAICYLLLRNERADVIADIFAKLTEDDFYMPDYRDIFNAGKHLFEAGQYYDAGSFIQAMKQLKTWREDTIGLLAETGDWYCSPIKAGYYMDILLDMSRRRTVIARCHTAIENAYDYGSDANAISTELETAIDALNDQRVGRIISLGESAALAGQAIAANRGRPSGIATGLADIDRITGGLQRGDMTIIAARPSIGKTALATNIAENIAEQGGHVLFFSYEMSHKAISTRILCGRTGISSSSIRSGYITERDAEQITIEAETLTGLKMTICYDSSLTPIQVRSIARSEGHKNRLSLVVLDYCQLVPVPGQESRRHEIDVISRTMKQIAMECDCPVILISQLNRMAEGREGNRPRLSDLRESGGLEQDADVVMLLYREDYYRNGTPGYEPTNTAEVIIAKHRSGPTSTIHLYFDRERTMFETLAKDNNFC